MRVAIIHYWLVGMRGGEKVIEELCRIYPQADIFTHVYDPSAVSDLIRSKNVKTSFISRLPAARKRYKSYLPLMPMALEQLDLRGYDLIISSEAGPSKGIIPPASALHVCYCHSPMRYIWNMYHDYRDAASKLTRFLMPPLSHYIRTCDVISAGRVHHFVANSQCVSERIETYYGRSSTVIYPPVDATAFETVKPNEVGDTYLMVGELVGYKRTELVIEAFNRLGWKLLVLGGGEMLQKLRSLAGPSITLPGPQPFSELRHHYARCRALVFAAEEDFGMVPVEAMAGGRPVVAFGRGGATETVVEGVSGTFFREQTVESIVEALVRFETMQFDSEAIVRRSRDFGAERFREEFGSLVENLLDSRRRSRKRFDLPFSLPNTTLSGAGGVTQTASGFQSEKRISRARAT
ncbi:glycosyltransferase [Beijerinckia sp. L45]|uniref:glycosyltransferase n=1 Tax=Beijerinckia sp. L45 TaxID=1641855 RepID=UPI00131DEF9F|nr:glycosyltransferase [Beijerinckia sp. L45]